MQVHVCTIFERLPCEIIEIASRSMAKIECGKQWNLWFGCSVDAYARALHKNVALVRDRFWHTKKGKVCACWMNESILFWLCIHLFECSFCSFHSFWMMEKERGHLFIQKVRTPASTVKSILVRTACARVRVFFCPGALWMFVHYHLIQWNRFRCTHGETVHQRPSFEYSKENASIWMWYNCQRLTTRYFNDDGPCNWWQNAENLFEKFMCVPHGYRKMHKFNGRNQSELKNTQFTSTFKHDGHTLKTIRWFIVWCASEWIYCTKGSRNEVCCI